MTKRWTEVGEEERHRGEGATREAVKAAAATLTEETRVWFEGVLAARDRQIEQRRAEDALEEAGALSAIALEAVRVRRAAEDAEWEANSQTFFRRRAEWLSLAKAAPAARAEREVQQERLAQGEAEKSPLSGQNDPDLPQ